MHARFLLLLFLFSTACSESEAPKSTQPEAKSAEPTATKSTEVAKGQEAAGLSSAKQAELKEVISALQEASPSMHSIFAATALAEIEVERLPSPLIATLEAISQASPAMRSMLISRGLAESILQVEAMCEGAAIDMMTSMAQQAPDTRLALIRKECNTDRFQLVSDPNSSTDPIAYLLAHVLLSHLERHGGVSADEKTLLRYLATAQTPASPY